MTKTIAVHDGTFHSDDALAVFFLRQLPAFSGARVLRTRDADAIAGADAVCDVGGVFDPKAMRFDHHQKDCKELFLESHIPLASCGMVYREFMREINKALLAANGRNVDKHIDYVCERMYFLFVQEIDAIDNGVEQYPEDAVPLYQLHTTISERIRMMNECAEFEDAVELIGSEYLNRLLNFVDTEIPLIDMSKKAFSDRFSVDSSGKIVLFDVFCKAENFLKRLEKESKIKQDKQLLYIVNPRTGGNWMIYAIGTGRQFESRKSLPFKGLRDEELSKACGIPGGIFVHKSGFLAAFKTKEQALSFAKLALNSKNE